MTQRGSTSIANEASYMGERSQRWRKALRFSALRLLNEVQRLRQIADYIGDPPSLEDATRAVEQAEVFVAAMRARL
jgi:hypothetical protein